DAASTLHLIHYSRLVLFQRFLVFSEDCCLNPLPRGGVDRMCDITVFAVQCLLARHRDKKSFFSFADLDIVNNELVVDRDRYHGFQIPFFRNFANTYICDLHIPGLLSLLHYFPGPVLISQNTHNAYRSFFSTTTFTPFSPTCLVFALMVSRLSTMQFSM